MPASDPGDLAARLDRVTYLLVVVIVLQAMTLLDLGLRGFVLFVLVGLFLTALYTSDV